MARVDIFRTVRVFSLAVAAALLLAAPARADLITLSFAGDVDLSAHGGAASNPFSGFFTWNTASTPFDTDGTEGAFYDVIAYQMIFNGIDYTKPIVGDGTGSGMAIFNDAFDPEAGMEIDSLLFFASLTGASPSGNDLIFLGGLGGPTTVWNTTALPTNTDFLPQFGGVSEWTDEIPGGGDDDDIFLGQGSFTITGTRVASVPEPATLVLTAFGLAAALARARRARR